MEPGESTTWNLSPNIMGPWRNAPRDRDDMNFTVEVSRIDSADDSPLYDSRFPESSQKRLNSLKERLAELEKSLLELEPGRDDEN